MDIYFTIRQKPWNLMPILIIWGASKLHKSSYATKGFHDTVQI